MATIKIDSFSGIMPRVHPTLLPDSCAVKAHNCRLKSGKLSPVREPSKVDNASIRLENGLDKIANAQSIYLWRHGENRTGEFLAWPGIVRVARGNIADDDRDRIFVSGETGVGGEGKTIRASRFKSGRLFFCAIRFTKMLPKPEIKVARLTRIRRILATRSSSRRGLTSSATSPARLLRVTRETRTQTAPPSITMETRSRLTPLINLPVQTQGIAASTRS